MNKNMKMAKELIRLAKMLAAGDNEFEEIAKRHGNVDKKVIKDMELSYSSVADYGDPHTYSIRDLYRMWLDDENARESCPDFEDWLNDITSKNGTCEWIDSIREELYSIDGVYGYTIGEAESIARQKPDAKILGENNEEWKACAWCEELFPKNEMKEEDGLGLLCSACERAISSRGERLEFENDRH